jgi:hypothetical protein
MMIQYQYLELEQAGLVWDIARPGVVEEVC